MFGAFSGSRISPQETLEGGGLGPGREADRQTETDSGLYSSILSFMDLILQTVAGGNSRSVS